MSKANKMKKSNRHALLTGLVIGFGITISYSLYGPWSLVIIPAAILLYLFGLKRK